MFSPKRFVVLGLFGCAISSVLISAAQRGGPGGQAPAGQAPAGQAHARGGQAGAAARGGRGGGPQDTTPVGVTIAGEVPNFVPVTDAMLKKQDDGDWLMIRRDYFASDYSPLNQITTANVKDLQLV